MEEKLKELVIGFVRKFEVVFDEDWEYTKDELNVGDFAYCRKTGLTEEDLARLKKEKAELREIMEGLFGKIGKAEPSQEDSTFISPDYGEFERFQDWCNAEALVDYYFELKDLLDGLDRFKSADDSALGEDDRLLVNFIECFETVFETDWKHTEAILGVTHVVYAEQNNWTDEQVAKCFVLRENFVAMYGKNSLRFQDDILKVDDIECKRVFLEPRCDISEYWPQGALLLKAYHDLKAIL